ncbi:amphi-Trp domain-containing protein [Solidesulfovibrio alcoholivorans]|uniref:amphi-Trp domain-containing protein n=1 Tax=Solidesulfovibrio alcoholivorans TaxID=81406 RepID=UPI00138E3BFB|nr:amphi-Trp domain-containing protein [Solidesulfovibrio alcoholivorans]
MEKYKFSREEELLKEDAAKIFEGIAVGLRSGCITISSKDNALSLIPWGVVDLSMQASQGKGKGKLKIAIKWEPGKTSFTTDVPATEEPAAIPAVEESASSEIS